MAENVNRARGATAQIDGDEVQETFPRQRQIVAGAQKRGVGEDDFGRQVDFVK